eukprot:CAMPEP_0171296912 /NCGR_PEP_ID=MMETSP0816-20121228/5638_1 /TAXON_ID=420281 /ORGANISM="Proboscia inermis, Strain CCAP1064/1" /LENGTH=312 /DNA_ID=CAMNT_0011770749 /DNA_START=333 /DNA_END=1274 /DNA_ORIENTATION=-
MATRQLALDYQRRLTESHVPTCPWKAEAERWLSSESRPSITFTTPSFAQIKSYVVPPFLLSVMKDLIIFENHAQSEKSILRYVRTLAQEFDRELVRFSCAESNESYEECHLEVNYAISFPPEFRLFIEKKINTLDLEDTCNFLSRALNIAAPNKTVIKSKESILLASFGWKVAKSEGKGEVSIECPICLASTCVYITNKNDPEDKFISGEMHLINSHRCFCPFVNGFIFTSPLLKDCAGRNTDPCQGNESNTNIPIPGWMRICEALAEVGLRSSDEKGAMIEKEETVNVDNLIRDDSGLNMVKSVLNIQSLD